MHLIAIACFIWGFWAPLWPNGMIAAVISSILAIWVSRRAFFTDRMDTKGRLFLASFITVFNFACVLVPIALAHLIQSLIA